MNIYRRVFWARLNSNSISYFVYCIFGNQDPFRDRETAVEAVQRGDIWGVVTFGSNYSESLVQRIDLGRYVDPSVIDSAEINFYMDMSSKDHFSYYTIFSVTYTVKWYSINKHTHI